MRAAPGIRFYAGLFWRTVLPRQARRRHVGREEAHPLVAHAVRDDRQHLRCSVDGGDAVGMSKQLTGPQARTAGELKHSSGRAKRLERRGQLLAARQIECAVLVFGRPRSLVGDLLGEQGVDVVGPSRLHPRR